MQNNNNNTNTNNISNNNELIFWKVFKNIFLFRKIISFLYSTSIRYGIYKYDEMKNVDWMITNKHFMVLLQKIRNVEVLSFYTNYALSRSENQSMISRQEFQGSILNLKQYITTKISENELDYWFNFEFYKLLFKNYKSNFIHCQNMVDTLVYYGNLNALKCIVEIYKLPLNKENFYNSIKFSNFKVSKYIYDTSNSLKSTTQTKIWEKSFKTLNFLTAKKVNERIDFLINSLKFTIPPKPIKSFTTTTTVCSTSTFKFKINEKIYEEPLQFLIDSCFSLLVLGYKKSSNSTIWETKKKRIQESQMELKPKTPVSITILNSYLNESSKSFKSDESSFLTFDQLSEIKNQFTENELSTKLFKFQLSLIDGTQLCSNQFLNNVSKLILMLLPFFSKKSYILNHLFYLIMYKQDKEIIYNETIDHFFQTLFQEESFFFKYCIGRIDKQIEYINSFILVKGIGCRIILNKFKLLIHMDSDIKLITLFRNFIIENFKIDQLNIGKINSSDIELSNQHLEQYINSFNIVNFNINLLFPNRINNLKWFKINYPIQYQLEFNKININLVIQNLEYGFNDNQDAINFIIENISDFLQILINNNNNLQLELINQIVTDKEQLEIYLKFGYYKSIPLLFYYLGNLMDINTIQFNKVYKFDILFDEIAKKEDLNTMEWILSNFNIQILTRFLLMSIHYNQLSIFKYINNHSQHQQLFIQNTMEKQVFLNILSKKALYCNHLDIIYYFKDILKINSLVKFKSFNNFK